MPQKSFLPRHIWETLSESTKQMIIEHNKKVKLNNPTPYPSGSKTKPNPTLGKSTPAPKQVHQHSQDEPTEEPPSDTSTQTLVNMCPAESGIDPTDIQNVMSMSHAKRDISSHDSSRQIQTHQRYVFARVNQSNHHLIDRGANGRLAGADMRVIHTTPRKINIVGIDDHELTGLNVVTAAALLDTQKGPIIGVFHEYAHLGKGRSIHAAGQMEWFNCQVDDRSKIVGGAQRIETSEGYVIPLSIESGLVYMHSIRIPTDQDLQNYPHVFFTSPDNWDASVLDHEITPSLLEDINQHSDDSLLQDSIFDEYGDLHHRAIQTLNIFCDLPSLPSGEPITHASLHDSNPAEEDWKTLRPYFGWQSEQVIKNTYKVTSRFGGTNPQHDCLKKHFKSRNPVFNIPRRNEPVATDTIFSDTPAINDGSTMAQFFIGRDTLVCDAYGIKTQKQFINTLYDNIRFRGAMTTLITDGGQYEISKKVADLLRSLFIKQHESEPYHQHQNRAEQRYGVVKRYINTLKNLTGAPAHCWLLCMLCVCYLLNATASPALGGLTPLQALTGQVPDISLSITKWMKVNLITDFPPNLMRREAIGLALLRTREINLPGRFLLMTLTLSSSDLLSGVPPRLHQTSGWTHHKGRINHKISHLMCLFMVGPILMDLITHHPCPSLILMTYWGEHFLWMRMGRERGLPFLNMSRISINNKSPEKISSDLSSRLMEINLMTSFHITNLWNT